LESWYAEQVEWLGVDGDIKARLRLSCILVSFSGTFIFYAFFERKKSNPYYRTISALKRDFGEQDDRSSTDGLL